LKRLRSIPKKMGASRSRTNRGVMFLAVVIGPSSCGALRRLRLGVCRNALWEENTALSLDKLEAVQGVTPAIRALVSARW
jgi:hypothetical protein